MASSSQHLSSRRTWTAARPSILTSLRGSSYEKACVDLAAKCNPQVFEDKFGASIDELQALVDEAIEAQLEADFLAAMLEDGDDDRKLGEAHPSVHPERLEAEQVQERR